MIKQTACILATLSLAACAADRTKSDWALDCDRNASEKGDVYAECKASAAAKASASNNAKYMSTDTTKSTSSSDRRLVGLTKSGYEAGEFGDGDKEADAAHVN